MGQNQFQEMILFG
jgi:hypothetical protein